MSDSVYVGQLPADAQESDLRKLFPKATTVQVTPAVGTRPGLVLFFFNYFLLEQSPICRHAFLKFPDDSSAAAAVKQGATLKNTPLKVGFQNKRAEPQKRSSDADDKSG